MDNKVAVVTGDRRGIGRAVCELFGEAGAKVVVCDIDADGAQGVAANLPGALAWPGDISDEGLALGEPLTMPGRVPLGRVSEPHELAAARLFLA